MPCCVPRRSGCFAVRRAWRVRRGSTGSSTDAWALQQKGLRHSRWCRRLQPELVTCTLAAYTPQIEAALRDGTTLEGFRRALLLVLLQVCVSTRSVRSAAQPGAHRCRTGSRSAHAAAAGGAGDLPARGCCSRKEHTRPSPAPPAGARATQDEPPRAPGPLRQGALQPLEDLLVVRARESEASMLLASALSLLRMLNSGAAAMFGGGARRRVLGHARKCARGAWCRCACV